jgi:hypothetical protein
MASMKKDEVKPSLRAQPERWKMLFLAAGKPTEIGMTWNVGVAGEVS